MSTSTMFCSNSYDDIFCDVPTSADEQFKTDRVPGADFDEVTYADDRICISRNIPAISKFVEMIGTEKHTCRKCLGTSFSQNKKTTLRTSQRGRGEGGG